jgi:hypothetical protein
MPIDRHGRNGTQRPGMPLTWPQVKANLNPRRFTIRTAPLLLRRTKAWVGPRGGSPATGGCNQAPGRGEADGVAEERQFEPVSPP